MSIVLVGSTSGSITLQEPAVAGTTVLDLPAVSGTILTTGSSGQSIPKAALPTGSVLQVIQSNNTTQVSTTSTSFVTTGFSASITPTSATSRVLILVSAVAYTATATAEPQLSMYRGGSQLGIYSDLFNGGNAIISNASFMLLDNPATTSSTTYTLYYRQGNTGSGGFAMVGPNSTTTNIILMEIAA